MEEAKFSTASFSLGALIMLLNVYALAMMVLRNKDILSESLTAASLWLPGFLRRR
jgi:hypothetical protein